MATRKASDIEAEMADVRTKIEPLIIRQQRLHSELREVKSRNFIEANNITAADVELSSGDGKPWFSLFVTFGKWMKENNISKRFCEWNGQIYFTTDAMAGRLAETGARVEDLPKGGR